jgi:cephalosporin-C deacetylase-like acetyl esterase
MKKKFKEFDYYPSDKEVDNWIEEIWSEGNKIDFKVEPLVRDYTTHKAEFRHIKRCQYIKFSIKGMNDFYGYWQPAISYPAPLLIHVPGYGAEFSSHPNLVFEGYNVLHITPLGYVTPDTVNESLKQNGHWPVLPQTAISKAKEGYKQWFIECIVAIRWSQKQKEVLPNRISFFGTSQGGGCSLILGSIYKDRGVRCVAADVPFLTNFPLASTYDYPDGGSYNVAFSRIKELKDPSEGWYALGFIDTLSHARRLTVPVMLTSGGLDKLCPAETINTLFEKLPGTKLYFHIPEQTHEYTQQFMMIATSWFRLYA